ncbi:MAG: 50S ribosomal protein L37e [Candidatus Woesearchaeota archaeon]
MSKGTSSMGEKSGKKTMMACRRCGRNTYHKRNKKCSSCGFGASAKLRTYNWKKSGK